jgi:predicted GH43/DUF377 family glycosyl hydrolase
LTFSRLVSDTDNHTATPTFERVTSASFVFGPHDDTDIRGTEDPRIAWDEESQLYYMFYTCWAKNKLGTLCLATTADPTSSGGWTRHGAAFGGNHKSGALLIRDEQSKPSTPHYLISGAGEIHISHSKNLLNWTLGPLFINETLWGNPHVEAGPPPMRLADGNFVFFLNSWGGKDVPQPGYQPAWVILDKDDPSHILARAPKPLWSPTDQLWMEGKPPSLCNVPQVAFLEAAHPAGKDNFRVYFGGADAVVAHAPAASDTATLCDRGPPPPVLPLLPSRCSTSTMRPCRKPMNTPPKTESRATVGPRPMQNGRAPPLRHIRTMVDQNRFPPGVSGAPHILYFVAAIQFNAAPLIAPAPLPARSLASISCVPPVELLLLLLLLVVVAAAAVVRPTA